MSFGGLHTDDRAIVTVAIVVFFAPSLVIVVLPAFREQALSASTAVTRG
jgi:hypothetical protein